MKMPEIIAFYGPSLDLTQRQASELQTILHGLEGFEVGRTGPGGGATATPKGGTILLLAVMAGGPRSRARETTHRYYAVPQAGSKTGGWGRPGPDAYAKCPLTGELAFGTALEKILGDPELAATVRELAVVREWPEAIIRAERDGRIVESVFVKESIKARMAQAALPGRIRTTCTIGGEIIKHLAEDIARADDYETVAFGPKPKTKAARGAKVKV